MTAASLPVLRKTGGRRRYSAPGLLCQGSYVVSGASPSSPQRRIPCKRYHVGLTY